MVRADQETLEWLAARRGQAPAGPPLIRIPPSPREVAPAHPAAAGGRDGPSADGGDAPPGLRPAAPAPPLRELRFLAGGALPSGEQVPGVPWLRAVPGVTYARPRALSPMLARKYSRFADAWDLAQEGGGRFVDSAHGVAYELGWLDERSLLFTHLGLRPGDRLISINGLPVGASMAAGQALFEQLAGQRRFAVLVLRDGQPLVLSFTVAD